MVFALSNDQTSSATKNPFVFWPHFISKYNLLLNSASLPAERLTVETDWIDNGRGYNHFLENTLPGGAQSSNGITPFTFR